MRLKLTKLRWHVAGMVAFLIGFPLAEKAMADDTDNIVNASLALTAAIMDVAGNS